MGLSGNKKRIKLSQDPNNTTWSRDTTNYGHRILAQQGWTPGQFLGAENASHAAHYSAANSSHIRVLLREDNLGLGARLGGKNNADTFGLSTLSGIFGRLNGKSEEVVQKQQGALRDAELRSYQAQKYGFMNFVSGGLLVGDKMEESVSSVKSASSDITKSEHESRTSKKKKAEISTSDGMAVKQAKDKKRKSSSPTDAISRVSKAESNTDTAKLQAQHDEAAEDVEDKQPKKKQRKGRDAHDDDAREQGVSEKDRLKQEKRERKIERRKRKEAKRLRREAESDITSAALPVPTSTVPTRGDDSDIPTPAPRPIFAGSRHAVRQRYIQQKRLASMDPKALKEILMITAKT